MCCENHGHDHRHHNRAGRRSAIRVLAGSVLGLLGLLIPGKASAAEEVCGAKCISLPYDGGTCTKTGRHQFHKCSKGHSW